MLTKWCEDKHTKWRWKLGGSCTLCNTYKWVIFVWAKQGRVDLKHVLTKKIRFSWQMTSVSIIITTITILSKNQTVWNSWIRKCYALRIHFGTLWPLLTLTHVLLSYFLSLVWHFEKSYRSICCSHSRAYRSRMLPPEFTKASTWADLFFSDRSLWSLISEPRKSWGM